MKYLNTVGYIPYSKIIREQRTRAGLTQEQLGTMLGVAPSTVNKWENGKREPSFVMFEKLLTVTGGEIQIITR